MVQACNSITVRVVRVGLFQDVEGVGPLSELDFWADRAVDLNSLTGQLASQRVQQVVQALAAAGSTYAPALER